MQQIYKLQQKAVIALLLVSLLASLAAGTIHAAEAKQDKAAAPRFTKEMGDALKRAEDVLANSKPFSDAAAVGFVKNGRAFPKGYLEEKADLIMAKKGQFDNVTDLVDTAISYMAAGGDINDIAGIDLQTLLLNYPDLENKDAEQLAQAFLISWYYSPYSISRNSYYPDLIYSAILSSQLKDGSWPDGNAKEGNVWTTARALTALGRQGDPEVDKMPNAGLAWLKSAQASDGGFDSSTATTAQVIIALSTLGDDAAAFTPSGQQPLNFLLSRQLPGGGFSEDGSSKVSAVATEQAYLALTAYKLFAEGKEGLYTDLNNRRSRQIWIQIEGPEGTIAEGRVPAGEPLETVTAFLKQAKIPYVLDENEHGFAFKSIGGIANGKFGGKDHWNAALLDWGSWFKLADGVISASLHGRERILIYYGNKSTPLINEIRTEWTDKQGNKSSGNPTAGEKFDLTFYKEGSPVATSGINVTINGQKLVTDKNGKVSVTGLPAGVYDVVVTGYRKNAAPSIAKQTLFLHVSSLELASFADQGKVAKWARNHISNALYAGLIKGVSSKPPMMLAPKDQLTRAEFVTMLMRMLHVAVDRQAKSGYSDVPTGKWYSGNIAKAAELGIIDSSKQKFEPNRAITRLEAAEMIVKAYAIPTFGTTSKLPFNDVSKLPLASQQAIQAVYEYQIMKGTDGAFNPHKSILREEVATVLMRVNELLTGMYVRVL
ncbi:hypothetical protein EBB07_00145 [Paenibacillaceae bacterium]|nr:hypothetical protein EBB07_00145 [Paenibacillaceae bacterium]